MNNVTPVHFGERLREVRIAKFGNQIELARFMHKHGKLKSPNQASVARWENTREFTHKSTRAAFEALKTVGVDPRYFFYAHITEWKIDPKAADIDEGDRLKLEREISALRGEVLALIKENAKLTKRVEELAEMANKKPHQ
jgi:transcriptional regulator with XRE-family HTH domain